MPKQVLTFSLDKTMVDAMDVLANGKNRTEWLRGAIREGITRRLTINEAAITQFHQLAGKASRRASDVGDAETAAAERKAAEKYLALIAQLEAEKLILYGAMGGV